MHIYFHRQLHHLSLLMMISYHHMYQMISLRCYYWYYPPQQCHLDHRIHCCRYLVCHQCHSVHSRSICILHLFLRQQGLRIPLFVDIRQKVFLAVHFIVQPDFRKYKAIQHHHRIFVFYNYVCTFTVLHHEFSFAWCLSNLKLNFTHTKLQSSYL